CARCLGFGSICASEPPRMARGTLCWAALLGASLVTSCQDDSILNPQPEAPGDTTGTGAAAATGGSAVGTTGAGVGGSHATAQGGLDGSSAGGSGQVGNTSGTDGVSGGGGEAGAAGAGEVASAGGAADDYAGL